MKKFRVLNLGAGVQSTTLALMSARGLVEQFDIAIFADTGEEPRAVYEHLEWLKAVLPFQILVRTAGKLGEDLIRGESGKRKGFASIPAFTSSVPGKTQGMLMRQCTKEYKTEVVERTIRRDLFGLLHRQRVRPEHQCIQYFGLSYDEPGRIIRVRARFAEIPWSEPKFPLFDMELTRGNCAAWLKKHFPEREIGRSACVFCPFKANKEWRQLKENDPEGWRRAVEIDHALRGEALANRNLVQKMYVHRSCVPLEDAVLREEDDRRGQQTFGFNQECEGMCGV